MDAARRRFLRGGMLTREGREAIAREEQALGPAPPWHREQLRQTVCVACDQRCKSACEADVIRIHGPNHRLAGTPYLSFESGGCTFCYACAEVCPMDLDGDASIPPPIGRALLQTTSCLAWNGVLCVACRFACTTQAIRADVRSRPLIDASRCTGCGACVRVCPEGAITVEVE